ncbi:DUF4344 domain-containing metallopeptidase [Nodosilinea sp. E11]|uniref:DUF4344 domain-containing metallopeptidase n=1 Tax=Nodosilinea sp. E11 TaxID=3037479 RepID=UPI0029351F31|nr:DUF4344 domain-containing metallopeptidase [Nodosilinea sp. E11]WOD38378.1 DUF4344 domain-containing metallopeptidase [Nodosilinea sp. E11]
MKRAMVRVLTLAMAAVLGACGGDAQGGDWLATDDGDFVLEYLEPENADHQPVYEALVESEFYDGVVATLNEQFALPQDIAIAFQDCGEVNAFYSPDDVAIAMCYELIAYYADMFYDEDEADYTQTVINAAYFTFFHELGHALVDQLELPIVSREEDAVDAFAAVLLLWQGEEEAAIAGIDQFSLDAEEEAELEELPYWDEHSLSEQRFYNMVCLVYGSDPDWYAEWVSEDFLPESRAEGCEAEFAQADESWSALLTPYLK